MREFAVASAAVVATLLLSVALPIGSPVQAQAIETSAPLDVTGTRWRGSTSWDNGEQRSWTAFFRADGVLEYSYNGDTFDNGRWTQREQLLTFHTNSYFALYSGSLNATGSEFSGVMYNRNGDRGSHTFTRDGAVRREK